MAASADAGRAAVIALVAETLAAARALHEALAHERSALERQEPDALSAATAAKGRAVAALEQLEARRRSLCRDLDHPTAPGHMPALLARCGARALADWQELSGIIAAAERLNAANGAIIHVKREQAAAALSILRGSDTSAGTTYGPAGARTSAASRRALARA